MSESASSTQAGVPEPLPQDMAATDQALPTATDATGANDLLLSSVVADAAPNLEVTLDHLTTAVDLFHVPAFDFDHTG